MQNSVLYNLKTPNSNVLFLKDRFVYQFIKNDVKEPSDKTPLEFENIEVKFVTPCDKMFFLEEGKLQSKTNYLLGNNKDNWITDIPNFQTLVYNGVYQNIDLKYYAKNNELKYDFVINPGADINDINLEFNGQKNIELKNGKLEITTASRKLIENIPLAYQIINGKKVVVKVKYKLNNNHVGFSCDSYNKSAPLIIDPILFYSTYIGGNGDDLYLVGNIQKDKLGNIYTSGYTNSTNFPTTAGVFQSGYGGGSYDAFVFKLNSTGTSLIYSTYIGGPYFDRINSIKLDTNTNELYACGTSWSGNFPTTAGAYQTIHASPNISGDAFFLKLSASGNNLLFSTLIGGINDDNLISMVFDNQGDVWIAGQAQSPNFPVTVGAYDVSQNGDYDCIVVKMNNTGSTLYYSTFIGGPLRDAGVSITIDNNNNAYVGTHTQGSFPTTPAAFDITYNGGIYDIAITKINSTLSTLVYSTYIGGIGDDRTFNDFHIDNQGNLMFSGSASSGFPTTPGSYNTVFNGGNYDVFVAELNSNGTAFNFSTLIGSTGDDGAWMCYKNHSGNIVVTGYCANNYPVTPCCYDPTYNGGNSDVFISVLNSTCSSLLYSTYYGGSSDDVGWAITCDYDTVYVTGQTNSSNFPITTGAYDASFNGGSSDYFALKIYLDVVPSVSIFNVTNNACSASCSFTNLSTGASTYTWLFGNGGTSSLTNPSYTYTTAGQYTVSLISNPGGSCADTSTNIITINSVPTAQFSVIQNNCSLNIFINNSSINTTNNNLDFGDGTHSNSLNPLTHTYQFAGTYTITLIADTNNICADTLYKIITISSPPTSNFSVVTLTCSMNSSFVNSSVGAITYAWLFDDGNTSQLPNPSHTFASAGQYTVSLIASSSTGCTDTSQQIITINNIPQAQFTITSNNCNNSIVINNTSTNASAFGWSFGDGSQSNNANPTHSYAAVGIYSITLVATTANGCADTLKKTVTLQNVNLASVFSVPATGCVGNFSFVNTSSNAQVYSWNFGDGSIISSQVSPVHNYTLASTYTVQLVAVNQTCNKYDTSYQSIKVLPTPIVHLGNDTSVCTGGGVAFNLNAGNPGALYQWSNGLTTQVISLLQPGSYWVTVTTNGCYNADTIKIYSPYFTLGNDSLFCGKESVEIKPKNINLIPNYYLWSTGANTSSLLVTEEGMYWLQITDGACVIRDTINVIGGYESSLLWVPNTFTPNNDGLNETFKPIGTDIIHFDMKIFNRWGEKIFETNDSNVGWNGTYKGQIAENATYVWLINYTTSCSKNSTIRKSGQVTIIK